MTPADSLGGRPSVLIVEDDEDLADLYALQLHDEYDVEVVNSGEKALETVSVATDVVLLDRHLPGISGDEVLVSVRDRHLDARVAMVTAVQPDFDVIDLGFDDYVVKPISGDRLRALVRRLLETDSYDALQRELSSLRVRRNVIRAEKPDAELRGNEAFQALEARIERLEARIERFESEVGSVRPDVPTVSGAT